ncbi:xylanase [Bacteroidia bacterium]|nr:xylanase [Bacteroidia bacterium]
MKRPSKIGLFFCLLGCVGVTSAQSDSIQVAPNELLVKAALSLLDTPYQANTLEVNDEEQLVVNLQAVDCMTFVEYCLALSRAAQYATSGEDYFIRELRYIRYRGGIIDNYTSRLHYTIDWITDNINKGVIEDLTHALGGKKYQQPVSFMSSHPELYPALRKNPQDVEAMKQIEQAINTRHTYYYIPTHEIREKQSLIKSGDIICFTTNHAGLDISHVGIAYWNKGQLTFIHASSVQKKVIINPEALADYCVKIKNNTGIMVLRVLVVNHENGVSE